MDIAVESTGGTNHRRRPPTEPARILVADDERLIADSIAASLRAIGYQVVGPAPDGAHALSLAAAPDNSPDLALLDISMPGISGLEAAAQLWNAHGIPAIIVSAYSNEEFLNQARQVGVFAYLLKPVTGESLRAAIAVAWAKVLSQHDNTSRISQLESNLRNRQTVEKAKWRLVERFGITEPDAHSRLQRAARDSRRPLADVALQIVESDDFSILGL